MSGDYFAPGWTDYRKRIQYQIYDVNRLLRTGRNAITVDPVRAGTRAAWARSVRINTAQFPYLRTQLELTFTDEKSSATVSTDRDWKSTLGPVLQSDLIMGTQYDARLATPGWTQPGYDDRNWKPVMPGPKTTAPLVAQVEPPVRAVQELKPVKVSRIKPDTYLYDMGQNRCRAASVRAKAGQVILRHGEVLNADGTLRSIPTICEPRKRRISITASGQGAETFEPMFTFHGFRYVEVSGAATELEIVGRVLTTDMP
ncbi:Alfa-L-rhamnosidase [Candidatus Burkholderia pumila]|uniref:Alfa-L-rhamnosidase n=1 Tax=Candidatus Burkholderia pumila TaxID=1090375 RepID=A0ABR5HLV6_9BURK|nr:Alfa-L-rhamnosidase [Candidatus Burkholderia pumila]